MHMAEFYLRRKYYSQTIVICNRAIKACAEVYGANKALEASILFMLACAYEGLKEYDKATLIYNSLLVFAEKQPGAEKMRSLLPLLKLGDIAVKQNNLSQALRLYKKAYTGNWLPYPIYRVLSYRLAICSMALRHNVEAESFFKSSLPTGPQEAGPAQLFDMSAQLLKNDYKYGGAELVLNQKAEWTLRHQEYLEWLAQRVSANSRFNLLNKITERDFFDFKKSISKDGEH